jgi:hypothetical protein
MNLPREFGVAAGACPPSWAVNGYAGADPTRKNKPGSTPFHLAVQTTGRGGSGTNEAKAAQRLIITTFRQFGVRPTLKDG